MFNVEDNGAIGDGLTDNTMAFRQTSAQAVAAGDGIVFVPNGSFVSGSFQVYSNCELFVSGGAIIYATTDVTKYFCLDSITSDTGVCDYALIVVANATNVRIHGPGIINGGANG